jgi:hypothetical protein
MSDDMKTKRKCMFLCIASGLMFALGIVRGIGGFIDLMDDKYFIAAINSNEILIVAAVLFSIFLTAAIFITSIGVFEQSKKYTISAIALVILFVIYNLANGYIFLGKLMDDGNVINIAASVIIISFLMLGNNTLKKT